jgi:hypothetical protein
VLRLNQRHSAESKALLIIKNHKLVVDPGDESQGRPWIDGSLENQILIYIEADLT